jgi:hypothetical protein
LLSKPNISLEQDGEIIFPVLGNVISFVVICFITSFGVAPLKGKFPNIKKYKITPNAHISIVGSEHTESAARDSGGNTKSEPDVVASPGFLLLFPAIPKSINYPFTKMRVL